MNVEAVGEPGFTTIDWIVVASYLAVVLGIGVWFARRASRSASDFILAGRSLPWWIAGTSIVATTFSSDTPLQVVKLVREGGIGANWWWWSVAAGQVMGVFLFAPLWRRSGLFTDVGFIGLRYEGGASRGLRIFEGLWQGLLVNGVVLASVTVGMATILRVVLDIDAEATVALAGFEVDMATLIVGGLAVATVGYSMLSGLYGVAWSDLPQFVIAMIGSIVLAVVVLGEVGGATALVDGIRHAEVVPDRATSFVPDLSGVAAIVTVVSYFTINWWSKAPGHGALSQRILATRDPRQGALALAWFVVAHYVLRPWPWIVVALASLVLVPTIVDPVSGASVAIVSDQEVFPWMIRHHLGPGLRGLLVVALLGAFMSTVDTHVNLSSAYLLNDVIGPLRRWWRGTGDEAAVEGTVAEPGRVWQLRVLALPVLGLVLLVASGFDDIVQLYKYLGVIAAGTAPVLILRWYWWRITAWTEIVAMGASLVVGNLLVAVGPFAVPELGPDDLFGPRLLATVLLSAVLWIPVTFLSRPTSDPKLARFRARVNPGGPGWRRVARLDGGPPPPGLAVRLGWILLGTMATWLAIMGTGWVILGRPLWGIPALTGALVMAIPTIRAAATLAAGASGAQDEASRG
ncbi:MAG: hypothetical protein CMJ34_08330 [Phycisphaerae bacterium]|nr:hypothetical protein [Phycisphaerae bacterium]